MNILTPKHAPIEPGSGVWQLLDPAATRHMRRQQTRQQVAEAGLSAGLVWRRGGTGRVGVVAMEVAG